MQSEHYVNLCERNRSDSKTRICSQNDHQNVPLLNDWECLLAKSLQPIISMKHQLSLLRNEESIVLITAKRRKRLDAEGEREFVTDLDGDMSEANIFSHLRRTGGQVRGWAKTSDNNEMRR